ncbi:uracil phosphoribosyltransferase [uncultured Negativibacillus sp.]|uniref:uracil phosphoribosyltransferase n=1 Tax=uncultured Negativibacillus sp. TaxID=1980696 RepID=UPI0025FDEC15|nr:uracil phosphoribosyltransferase [uncultured Negativibacillus sp.]
MTPMILDHPLIQHKISLLRNKNTGSKEFRELVSEVSMLMCYEATRDLPLKEVEVETPISIAKTKVIAGRKLAFVPILRAGIGMLDGVLSMVPAAKVGHIGLYRDPQTLQPVRYYCKLPSDINEREVIVLDPMLATGGSAVEAINMLKESGATNIKYMCIIAAPEGLNALTDAHPDVQVYCAAKDEKLNDEKYIVPGLGDCGDRIFGTK